LFVIKMLTAIYLNDQLRSVGNEINNVGSDWRLPTKADALETMGAQNAPQSLFGFCGVRPH
jgi:hypothetical protein